MVDAGDCVSGAGRGRAGPKRTSWKEHALPLVVVLQPLEWKPARAGHTEGEDTDRWDTIQRHVLFLKIAGKKISNDKS